MQKQTKAKTFPAPVFHDKAIETLISRFDATVAALTKSASRTVQANYAGELAEPPQAIASYHRATYPVTRPSQYVDLHWQLMHVLAVNLD